MGTLSQAKARLRSKVSDTPSREYYAAEDLMTKFTIGYVVAGGLSQFGVKSISDSFDVGDNSYDAIMSKAREFVDKYVHIKQFDVTQHAPRSLEHKCIYCGKLYVRPAMLAAHETKIHQHSVESPVVKEPSKTKKKTKKKDSEAISNAHKIDQKYNYTCQSITLGLIWLEQGDAIAMGDGDRIMLVDKYLTLLYKEIGCPKYAYGLLELQAQVNILLSPRDAYLLKWNRTVNERGECDTNYPNDKNLEHQNKVFKADVKTYRGTFTDKTLARVSQSTMPCDKVVANFDKQTGVHKPSGRHSLPDWSEDIEALAEGYLRHKLFTDIPGRRHNAVKNMPTPHILRNISDASLSQWILKCMKNHQRKHYYEYA